MIYLFFVGTFILSVITYFIKNRTLSHTMVFLYVAMMIGLGLYLFPRAGQNLDEYFFSDRLGLIFFTLLIIIKLVSAVHYIKSSKNLANTPQVVALHNAGTIFFTGAMIGVLFTSHFGTLWAFMEATTLGASVLIYHNRNQDALEATWKYLYVCSIGIALAFTGVLFLAFAAQQAGHVDFTFASIKAVSAQLNTVWLKACFLLVVTGFSVKMGLVPLFNVDIDAKDASPSQVGASLSSVLMNAGFVSIYRFYEAFSATSISAMDEQVARHHRSFIVVFCCRLCTSGEKCKAHVRLFQHGTCLLGDDCLLVRRTWVISQRSCTWSCIRLSNQVCSSRYRKCTGYSAASWMKI